ncbi:LysR family transcriptional regulator [Azohydromonas lata]|uniref:LysR family transcriptional regulator n=1 Tax=Azohydromonas lata TaxID=45677 RepID=UPI000829FCAD|nr:LysR substrate-binding domain-containing protein [Azohydromonas lata]
MFTLKQLAVFDAIARLGSVSEAAEQLGMTQPAASMSLQQLEQMLGAELFVRVRKRLVLSEKGKALQPMARSMLVQAEEITTSLASASQQKHVRIGASPTVGDYLLNEICPRFQKRHPQVRLSISVMPAFDVINRVDEMALDLGLIEFITVRPTLDMLRWRQESLVVFCSPEHPLSRKKRLRAADLKDQRWCLQHRFSDTRRQFTLALLNHLSSLEVVLESDSLNILRSAVETGIGLGCLPRPCIARELNDGRLQALAIEDLDLTIPISIVSRKDVRKSKHQEDFVAELGIDHSNAVKANETGS